MHIIHMHTQNYADTRNRMLYVTTKMWIQMHKRTKREASVIKASVGPGERRSLFQIPKLPHWYHSVQFCSCNSIVCPRDQSGLAMLIVMWTYGREYDQYCDVLLPFGHIFTVMLYNTL